MSSLIDVLNVIVMNIQGGTNTSFRHLDESSAIMTLVGTQIAYDRHLGR